MIRIAKGEVGHVDGLVVRVATATVRVAQAVWVLRGEPGVLDVLRCQPTLVGDISGR